MHFAQTEEEKHKSRAALFTWMEIHWPKIIRFLVLGTMSFYYATSGTLSVCGCPNTDPFPKSLNFLSAILASRTGQSTSIPPAAATTKTLEMKSPSRRSSKAISLGSDKMLSPRHKTPNSRSTVTTQRNAWILHSNLWFKVIRAISIVICHIRQR